MSDIEYAVQSTKLALEENPNAHWVVGFSGGKDSTAVLKILFAALSRTSKRPNLIDIIYCDTGVENPVLDDYVKTLFSRIESECADLGFPLSPKVLKAPINNRFFVKLIGRGYPPPNNNFRWCTKNLRIRPVSEFIRYAAKDHAIVCLGMRKDESEQRSRSVTRYGCGAWQRQHEAGRAYDLFLPILDFGVPQVWETLFELPIPRSIDAHELAELYRGASGECPIIKSPDAPPCGAGRLGCWTCTVVRQDRSARKMIEAGYSSLSPFLDFRDWLSNIRNDADRRWSIRRNGTKGKGPFTLAARYEIFQALRRLEQKTGKKVLEQKEVQRIVELWECDVEIDKSMNISEMKIY